VVVVVVVVKSQVRISTIRKRESTTSFQLWIFWSVHSAACVWWWLTSINFTPT